MRTLTNVLVQQVNVKEPWACVWVGETRDGATLLYVQYPYQTNDPLLAADAAAKVDSLVAALVTGNRVDVNYGDTDTFISGVLLHAGTSPQPPLDPRYRLRDDFTLDDAHNDPRYRPRNDFATLDDPHNDQRYRSLTNFGPDDGHNDLRYRPLNNFTGDDQHNDPRYRPRNDFATLDDPHNDARYMPIGQVHDALQGAGAPRHHLVLAHTVSLNVSASGLASLTPSAFSLPVDTLTRNPVVLRVSAWRGTSPVTLFLSAVGPLDVANGAWPIRVIDPAGIFSAGATNIELVVRIDPA